MRWKNTLLNLYKNNNKREKLIKINKIKLIRVNKIKLIKKRK